MMSEVPEVIGFSEAAQLPKAGIHYPSRRHQLDWMFRRRNENGLAEAFAVVNGRKLFLPRKYLELIRARGRNDG